MEQVQRSSLSAGACSTGEEDIAQDAQGSWAMMGCVTEVTLPLSTTIRNRILLMASLSEVKLT